MSDKLEESLKLLKQRLLVSPGAYCQVSRVRIREASAGLHGEARLLPALVECGFVKKLSREFYRIQRATA